jgi:hypothetical protein
LKSFTLDYFTADFSGALAEGANPDDPMALGQKECP